MASVPTFSPNPYANFDPSQWSDPYSPFQSGPIPFPSTYSGWPTDSMGNPIQPQAGSGIGQPSAAQIAAGPAPASAPGTTLNSSPASQAYQMNPQTGMMAPNPAAFSAGNFAGGVDPQTGQTLMQANAAVNRYYNPQPVSQVGGQSQGWGGTGGTVGGQMMAPSAASMQAPWAAQAAAPAPPAPAANPSGLSSAQYLQLLAHPNPVVTPGATVPQAPTSYQPNNSVLQQFLANWAPAKSGPGSGFQQAFAKGLKGS
jgi:hypothetical protein